MDRRANCTISDAFCRANALTMVLLQFQELFAICQALPGPGSTKMGFCIAFIRGGFLAATMFFLTWRWAPLFTIAISLGFIISQLSLIRLSGSQMDRVLLFYANFLFCFRSLPGAAGMYALAIGISRVSNILPSPVYALLSGLNASTVGVIAFAAVQLANKAITDPLSRLIVVFSACAGLCYNALWYFPVLMVGGGITTVVWDLWARSFVGRLKSRWRRPKREEEILEIPDVTLPTNVGDDGVSRRSNVSLRSTARSVQERQDRASADKDKLPDEQASKRSLPEVVSHVGHIVPAKIGVVVVVLFLGMFRSTELARLNIVNTSIIIIQHLSSPLWSQMLGSSFRRLRSGCSATCI